MPLNKPSLPAGQYTTKDLVNEGLLAPGKNIKINDKIYLAIGNSTVTKLIDLQSNIKYPVDVIVQGKIKVSALEPHEIQQVKQVYDSYKSGKEILRMAKKKQIESVSFKKGSVISLAEDKDSGLSTQALIETADNVVKKEKLSSGETPIKLHEAKQIRAVVDYKEVQTLQNVLETQKDDLSFKDVQDIKKKLKSNGQDNVVNTLEAFEQINKSKPKAQQTSIKSLISDTLSKKSSGESVVTLSADVNANKYSSVTFTNDVSKSVQKILDTHKVSDSINPNKSLIGNKSYNKYQLFSNTPSNEALKFTENYQSKKDVQVKIAEIEFQKFAQNSLIDKGNNHEILNQISSRATSFDKRLKTNLKERIQDKAHLYSEVKSVADLGFIDVDDRSGLKQIQSASKQFQQIQNLSDGLKIGYNGTVINDNSTGSNFVAQNIIKNQAIQEFNNSHIKTADIFKTIKDTSPENLNKLSGYLKKKKNATLERYPRNIQNQTGLLGIATGIVGTYFYQQMLTGAALKAHRLINNFIEPSEVIEAKRHSSIETSTRRILSTDFGGGWTPLASVIKDIALNGRTGAIQFINANKTAGGIEKLRNTFDPIFAKGKDITKNLDTSLSAATERLKKFITGGGVSDLIKEGMSYVNENKISIGTVAGGVILFSRLGSNDWITGTKEYDVLKKKYRGAHYRDFLETNSVQPDDWRDSLTRIDSKVVTGFGSPWQLKNSLNAMLGVTSKGARLFSLSHKTAKELAEKYVQEGAGHQMARVGTREFQAGTRDATQSLIKEIDSHVIAAFYSKKSADVLSAMSVLNPGQTAVLNKNLGKLVSLSNQPVHTKTKEFAELYSETQKSIAHALVGMQKKQIEKTLFKRIDQYKKRDKILPIDIPKPIQGRLLNKSKYNVPRFKMRQREALNITELQDGNILLTRKTDVSPTTLKRLVASGGVKLKNNDSSRFIEVSFQGRSKPKQVVAITNTGRKVPQVEADLSPQYSFLSTDIALPTKNKFKLKSNQGEQLNELLMDKNKVSGNNYARSTNVLQRLTSLSQ